MIRCALRPLDITHLEVQTRKESDGLLYLFSTLGLLGNTPTNLLEEQGNRVHTYKHGNISGKLASFLCVCVLCLAVTPLSLWAHC